MQDAKTTLGGTVAGIGFMVTTYALQQHATVWQVIAAGAVTMAGLFTLGYFTPDRDRVIPIPITPSSDKTDASPTSSSPPQ